MLNRKPAVLTTDYLLKIIKIFWGLCFQHYRFEELHAQNLYIAFNITHISYNHV